MHANLGFKFGGYPQLAVDHVWFRGVEWKHSGEKWIKVVNFMIFINILLLYEFRIIYEYANLYIRIYS